MKNNTKETSNKNPIVYWFCGIIALTLTILIGYLCHSTKILRESQEQIVTAHVRHIADVDSLFCGMKEVVLSNDTGVIANASILLSQLHKDSALFKREILLSQEEMCNLVELHMDKIENDYAQIGIWGGVLSVIFIIFGFFAIFKLEETKSEARAILNDITKQGDEANKQIGELQSQASELNGIINSLKQEGATLYQNKEKEFNDLMTNLSQLLAQAGQDSTKIEEIRKEIEEKNGNYQMSLDAMKKQLKQYEALSIAIQEVFEKIRKEAANEQPA